MSRPGKSAAQVAVAAATALAFASLAACQEPRRDDPSPAVASSATPVGHDTAAATSPQRERESVYRSRDGGRSWAPLAVGMAAGAVVRGFAFHGGAVLVATERHGVQALGPGASTWQARGEGIPQGAMVTAIAATSDGLVLGTSNHGVLVSLDEGAHWGVRGGGGRSELAAQPVRCFLELGRKLLAGTDTGIFASTDGGARWSHAFAGAQINGLASAGHDAYAAAVGGVLRSRDRGASWAWVMRGDTPHDITTDGQRVFAGGMSRGLLRSADDGATWQPVNDGLPDKSRWYTFQVRRAGDALLAAHWDGIYRSGDEGQTWTRIEGGLPMNTAYTHLAVTPLGIFAGAR